MKKKYEKPMVEHMEFDYSKVITTSGTRCFISSMSVTWNDSNGHCENHVAGDQ